MSSYRTRNALRLYSLLTSFICITFGSFIICGWIFEIESWKGGALSNGITVKANTGFAFLISGISLTLINAKQLSNFTRISAIILASILMCMSALIDLQHLFNLDFTIDQIIAIEVPGEAATASPNRMGPPAATSFFLTGLAVLLILKKNPHSENKASICAIIIGIIATLSTLGYLYGASVLYAIAKLTGISFTTAICLLILSSGIFTSCRRSEILKLFFANDSGGILLRRMLLPCVILPAILGYVAIVGFKNGLYDAPFGTALLVVYFVLIFTSLLISCARIVKKTDSERIELLESERAARTEAENAAQSRDEFLATLSHELRTPLNAILGWAQLLKRGELRDEHIKGVNIIEKNARIQAQFIEDMLDMSRSIAGKLVLNSSPLNLIQIIKTCVDAQMLSAKDKKIELQFHTKTDQAIVMGDSERLFQVFSNLLTNAIKFSSVDGRIWVTAEIHSGQAEVSVIDTGQGIKKEFIDHLFDRFRQEDGSITRRYGGLGIGLSIVKDLVTLHQGTIEPFSEGEAKGTTFTVKIPLADQNYDIEEAQINNNWDPESNCINLKGDKILVVDDHAETRELLCRILETYNATVVTSSSVDEGLELLKKENPDILISDIGMPERDGYDLIKTIRNMTNSNKSNIPAIALTAFVRKSDKANAFSAGFQYHLSKPLDANELLFTILQIKNELINNKD